MSLGISVNPLEDVITPEYIAALKAMAPKFLRYPEGATGQNYFWATSPSWQPESHAFINRMKWPANDKKYYDGDRPKMFNLRQFMELCDIVGATPIIVVPLNPLFANVAPTPFEKLVENAVQLVRYIKRYDVLYQIGNESTMSNSADGFTTADKYSYYAGLMIEEMKKVAPKAICLVNGNTIDEWRIVSKTPKADGVIVHNYPGWSVDQWATRKSSDLAKKVEDCKKASGGLDVYVMETNSTNFTPQRNNVAMALMNADILLNTLALNPKCVIQWVSRWSVGIPFQPSIYDSLTSKNGLTCSGEMLKMILFAINKTR
jgi:hypothetical protein